MAESLRGAFECGGALAIAAKGKRAAGWHERFGVQLLGDQLKLTLPLRRTAKQANRRKAVEVN